MLLVNQKEFCFLMQRALPLVTYPSSRQAAKKKYEKALPLLIRVFFFYDFCIFGHI